MLEKDGDMAFAVYTITLVIDKIQFHYINHIYIMYCEMYVINLLIFYSIHELFTLR